MGIEFVYPSPHSNLRAPSDCPIKFGDKKLRVPGLHDDKNNITLPSFFSTLLAKTPKIADFTH